MYTGGNEKCGFDEKRECTNRGGYFCGCGGEKNIRLLEKIPLKWQKRPNWSTMITEEHKENERIIGMNGKGDKKLHLTE